MKNTEKTEVKSNGVWGRKRSRDFTLNLNSPTHKRQKLDEAQSTLPDDTTENGSNQRINLESTKEENYSSSKKDSSEESDISFNKSMIGESKKSIKVDSYQNFAFKSICNDKSEFKSFEVSSFFFFNNL